MTNEKQQGGWVKPLIALAACLAVLVGASVLGWLVQRDFGRVDVGNVVYPNYNGITIRAKLFKPRGAGPDNRLPGVVYIHGYQNNRETGDAYCLELARRGMVVLNIDAIGRGNSGPPGRPERPDFDPTYGGKSSLAYLKSLDCVDPERVGLVGHSLGASMAYRVALQDPSVTALVISGFAYTTEADTRRPRNMLMIFGKWDEYRGRMTGVRHFEEQWMKTPATLKAFGRRDAVMGRTYGDFSQGTARRVFMPRTIHIGESHSSAAIAEALRWMRAALAPPAKYWIEATEQIWAVKEWSTLVAMLAGLASLLPLGLLLLRLPFFASLRQPPPAGYHCPPGSFLRLAGINGLLMWLYLPLIYLLFGLHIYVVHIDRAFPLMMVNAIVWWFVLINLLGLLLFRFWLRRRRAREPLELRELGVSYSDRGFSLPLGQAVKTIILAAVLVGLVYACEHLLEAIFIVDWRFLFPFASDLTPARAWLCLRYFPFLLAGFLVMGLFLHGQLRLKPAAGLLRTWVKWSAAGIAAMVIPLVLFMAVQYIPLFVTGYIPFRGPGGMLTNFVMSLMHIIGVLIMVIPISTWFFQLTGRIYLGALVCAGLVTWFFVSSQVIAPIPV